MAERQPVAERSFEAEDPTVKPWKEAREVLVAAQEYWLATVRPDGRPHAMPLLGLWIDGALYFGTGASSVKARNLAGNPNCVITVGDPALDLSVEGKAAKVADEATLHRVADAYAAKYGWRIEVRDGGVRADDAIGAPPYEIYEVVPDRVIGIGKDTSLSATRWRFA
ncbi:pyridoxamine 5'-phosphate oxidase [Microtetraspora sp. NBRC 13810]|uniref:pyridoxamine 5'-phosphate oxidase family protein n=1 Tax=Microtetraspora sp. NBRC 13810 TaxID=3030990 RepID=UPI0024A1CC13|nr:pyridoxamine 5'-phosphate oxidase family protein [Microtetraspora sp. NBRC 13810]GLW05783.1 pyridoxamine 5'-phosphate oxidase [Microtetraspora sp. NBRC 13810]